MEGLKQTTIAKSILKCCRQETNEIYICPECYLNANSRADWFTEVCTQPHLLLWAKLKGFPYWPAKVMGSGQGSFVNVRFFGEHDRAYVPVKDCYLFSEQNPNTQTGKRSSRELADCMKEVNVHIENIKNKIGKFCYAPFKTPYEPMDELKQLEEMMPGVTDYINRHLSKVALKPSLQYKIVKTADNNLSIIKKTGEVNEPDVLASKYEVISKVYKSRNCEKVHSVILKRKSIDDCKKLKNCNPLSQEHIKKEYEESTLSEEASKKKLRKSSDGYKQIEDTNKSIGHEKVDMNQTRKEQCGPIVSIQTNNSEDLKIVSPGREFRSVPLQHNLAKNEHDIRMTQIPIETKNFNELQKYCSQISHKPKLLSLNNHIHMNENIEKRKAVSLNNMDKALVIFEGIKDESSSKDDVDETKCCAPFLASVSKKKNLTKNIDCRYVEEIMISNLQQNHENFLEHDGLKKHQSAHKPIVIKEELNFGSEYTPDIIVQREPNGDCEQSIRYTCDKVENTSKEYNNRTATDNCYQKSEIQDYPSQIVNNMKQFKQSMIIQGSRPLYNDFDVAVKCRSHTPKASYIISNTENKHSSMVSIPADNIKSNFGENNTKMSISAKFLFSKNISKNCPSSDKTPFLNTIQRSENTYCCPPDPANITFGSNVENELNIVENNCDGTLNKTLVEKCNKHQYHSFHNSGPAQRSKKSKPAVLVPHKSSNSEYITNGSINNEAEELNTPSAQILPYLAPRPNDSFIVNDDVTFGKKVGPVYRTIAENAQKVNLYWFSF